MKWQMFHAEMLSEFPNSTDPMEMAYTIRDKFARLNEAETKLRDSTKKIISLEGENRVLREMYQELVEKLIDSRSCH